MARWRSCHVTVAATWGPRWVELRRSKVVVSWLLYFHVLFRSAPKGPKVEKKRGRSDTAANANANFDAPRKFASEFLPPNLKEEAAN